jgi:hypothetical protein
MATNNSTNEPTAASGKVLQGQGVGTASAFSTATYPSSSGGSGKILYDNGTNFVESTPTFPASASATSRKIIVSDGTNWTASTETWAVPGSSGNYLKSDGTNWTSAAAPIASPGSSTNRAIATWNGTSGNALFNNSTITIDSTGRVSNTAQPAFSAYVTTQSASVTGDGTLYKIVSYTSTFDQGSNFNTTTGTYTAPIAGRYQFNYTIWCAGVTASHNQGILEIITTSQTVRLSQLNWGAVRDGISNIVQLSGGILLNMSASDTASLNVIVSSGTKVVQIGGGTGPYETVFSGFLVC